MLGNKCIIIESSFYNDTWVGNTSMVLLIQLADCFSDYQGLIPDYIYGSIIVSNQIIPNDYGFKIKEASGVKFVDIRLYKTRDSLITIPYLTLD